MTENGTGGSPIIFYYDYSSPFAYLAAHKINELAKLYDRTVDWRPTLLGAVFALVTFWENHHLQTVFGVSGNMPLNGSLFFFHIAPDQCHVFPLTALVKKLLGQMGHGPFRFGNDQQS